MSVCFVCFMLDCVGEFLLNAFAICVDEVNVFSLKVMVLFFCWLIRVLSSKECVCVVIPVCVYVFPPYVRCMCV